MNSVFIAWNSQFSDWPGNVEEIDHNPTVSLSPLDSQQCDV